MFNRITNTPKSLLFHPYKFIGYLKNNELQGFDGGLEAYSDRLLLSRKSLTKLCNYKVIHGSSRIEESTYKLQEKEILQALNKAIKGSRLKFITESLNSRHLSIFEKSANGKWRFVKNSYENIKRF